MLERIRVLMNGREDRNEKYQVPDYLKIDYISYLSDSVKETYDIVILEKIPKEEELPFFYDATKEYCLFVDKSLVLEGEMLQFFLRKKGKVLERENISDFLNKEAQNYFSKPYGEKFSFNNLSVSTNFEGDIQWKGNYSVCLNGNFGSDFRQIAYWKNNIPIEKGQALELWLEYEKDSGVEIVLSIVHFASGTLSDVEQSWYFTEEDMKNPVIIDNQKNYGPIFVSLQARGEGKLEIIALHDRYSRRGHGYFIPGGERYVTSNREEVFAYFNPGDMKPPLHVYFSGYKTRQGFEGYNLMKSLGSPFLLIAEGRLEGGCFYFGNAEYEGLIKDVIRKYQEELGFDTKDIIMSGLSMGTFGALYYGADILPHAIVLGKPLSSVGDIAANERLNRPGGFPTSLDVSQYAKYCLGIEDQEEVNDIFWNKLKNVKWNGTKFVVSYMIEDDYDGNSYHNLISRLDSKDIQIYGKGIHGRHNDKTGEIIQWYNSQLRKILREDYQREPK